ncbi:MAG: guanylate kinase [Oscillospiraceae bacterium]|jgi:guanylate kinase|nr:guanylate kinase [Oscillospiraceae bacterium]
MKKQANKGTLVIFSGPSGSGKDTVLSKVLERDPSLKLSVSFTTRARRADEIDGVHYHFLTQEQFRFKLSQGLVLEYAEYGGSFYGTPKGPVDEMLAAGQTVILKIEVQGAARVRKVYPDALAIFLMPPSPEVLEKRLRARRTDAEEQIQTRLAIAREEIRRQDEYRFCVVNDDLERAADDVLNILHDSAC